MSHITSECAKNSRAVLKQLSFQNGSHNMANAASERPYFSTTKQTPPITKAQYNRQSFSKFLAARTIHTSETSKQKTDFFVSLLSSAATKREARSYLSRFKNGLRRGQQFALQGQPIAANQIQVQKFPSQNASTTTEQAEELDPGQLHLALVKFKEPELVSDEALLGIGKSLAQLSMLGMSCCVVVEPGYIEDKNAWRKAASEQAYRVAMAIDANHIGEAQCLEYASMVDSQDKSLISMMSREYFMVPLRMGKVLVVPPIAYTKDSPRAEAVSADDMIIALTKDFRGLQLTIDPEDDSREAAARIKHIQNEVSLDRVIIMDMAGGLPAPRRGSDKAHIFINLEQEYDDIVDEITETMQADIDASKTHSATIGRRAVSGLGHSNPLSKFTEEEFVSLPEEIGLTHSYDPHIRHYQIMRHHLENLNLLRGTLSVLPPASSGIILTPQDAASSSLDVESRHFSGVQTRRQRNPLIHNLLTDKPLHSPSLPVARMGISRPSSDNVVGNLRHSTFVKKGMPLTIFPDPRVIIWKPAQRGQGRMRLDDHRIDLGRLKYLIEDSFGRKLDLQHYLDRIGDRLAGVIIAGEYEGGAILTWELPPGVPDNNSPSSLSRMVPYLDKFAVLRKSQGAGGVADVVFNAMVRGCFPNGVCWRSRRDNPVNKWYFERSRGSWKLPDTNWAMFWTTPEVPQDEQKFHDYEAVCRNIEPSWADGKPDR